MTKAIMDGYLEQVRELAARCLKFALEGKGEPGEALELKGREEGFWSGWGARQEEGELIPMEYLCRITGCTDFERHSVLMALAWELDDGTGREKELPLTPSLLFKTWTGTLSSLEYYQAFREDSRLMELFFTSKSQDSPYMGRPMGLRERVLSFFLWDLRESPRLRPFLTGHPPQRELPPLQEGQPDIASILKDRPCVAEVWGPEGSGRRFCIRRCCGQLGLTAYEIHLERLAQWGEKEWEEILGELRLEFLIFQAIPVLVVPNRLGSGREAAGAGDRGWPERVWEMAGALRPVCGLVFIVATGRISGCPDSLSGERLALEVRDLSLNEKRRIWLWESRPYRLEDGVRPEEMANLFPFTWGNIKRAFSQADCHARSQGKEAIGRESLRYGCYSLLGNSMTSRAARIPLVYGWDDLVLPQSQKGALLSACGQVKHKHQIYESWGFQRKMPYGKGVSMIFSGPPGTGKTMAAQVVALELGIELYKIDLTAVVSKYVGETEKNLNEIFEQARESQIVLLFDEADVLFSKRTEVKDANDKYSNMEAAFLLQKMESYEGITILATNLIQNFDEAFKRRVKFVIDFPFPNAAQRRELWQRALPSQAPAGELDYEYLASRFELSGSNIRNVVLHAAFLAASGEGRITMREMLLALKNEFSKSGKILTKEDAGEYYMFLPGGEAHV